MTFEGLKYTMSYDYLKENGKNKYHLRKESHKICDLLNEQEQEIKELKQYNKHLQEQNINLLMRLEKLEQRK